MQIRLLWQQRVFAKALSMLLSHIGPDWRQQLPSKAALLLALAHLLDAVPPSLYRSELPSLLPLVAAGLQPLAAGPLASTSALLALLQVLSHTLAGATGLALAHPHLGGAWQLQA